MENGKQTTTFHDLLGLATSVRSYFYLLKMKKSLVDKESENDLTDCLKKCDQLVNKLQKLQKECLNKG